MSPHDIRRRIWDQLRQKDLRAFAALLPAEVVLQAARCAVVPAGSGVLNVLNLTWLALASALHTLEDFKAVLDHTLKLVEDGPDYLGSATERARRAARPARAAAAIPAPPTSAPSRRRPSPRPASSSPGASGRP